QGGGTYYDSAGQSGTLRLNVITVRSPRPLQPSDAGELVKSGPGSKKVESLPNGLVLATFEERAVEDDTPLVIHYWQIAQVVMPDHGRIAVFSHTLTEAEAAQSWAKRELVLLDQEIRSTILASEPGISTQ